MLLTRNGLIEKQFVVHYFLPRAEMLRSFNDLCIKKWPQLHLEPNGLYSFMIASLVSNIETSGIFEGIVVLHFISYFIHLKI